MELNKKEQVSNLSGFIWKIADDLWGDFKHTDFARIIIPFLLLRRLECVLEKSKDSALAIYNEEKDKPLDQRLDLNLILPTITGLQFFNTSNFTLSTIGSSHTADNLEQYVSHFSSNVRLAFEEFGFSNTIDELDKAKLLYRIAKQFSNIDLHPEVVSNRVLSNAYEELIRKFAASINDKAGEFMTPKDVVHLTTKIVLSPDEEVFTKAGVIRSIYDPTCGILGFITDAMDLISEFNPEAKIIPYGQELDPKTHAMALTLMLIQGFDSKNIQQGSTLSNDKFIDKKFHYGLANPPFGIKWEKDKASVLAEHEKLKFAGRFGPGLPRVSDGSMLFLMHLVSKMEDPKNGGGRVGIVLSGSPLFTGDAGSGESEIRRWLLESDLVEAIIALPNDMFFNTGIGTYVWILSNKKEERRANKVQLINLSDTWTSMRKSEGTKRKYLTNEQIDDVVREYEAFVESERVKIFKTADFAFRKVSVKRPLRGKLVVSLDKLKGLLESKNFQKLSEDQQQAWISFFTDNQGEHDYNWCHDLITQYKKIPEFGKLTKALGTDFTNLFFEHDDTCDVITDSKGDVIPDTSLNDTESIPYDMDVNEYMDKEVLPHVPDAYVDESVIDHKDGQVGLVGYEINFNRYFYKYVPPRDLAEIDADLKACEARIQALLSEVAE